jgi:hypothetical protein
MDGQYPGWLKNLTRLIYHLYERPLYVAFSTTKSLRARLYRLVYDTVANKVRRYKYHTLSSTGLESRILKLHAS